MLLVRTTLAPSPIHGIGVFAAEPIRQHALVWRFCSLIDRVYDLPEFKKTGVVLPFLLVELLQTYASQMRSGARFLCGDNARFINHADASNLSGEPDAEDDYAVRDIAAGEELTINYRSICAAWRDDEFLL